MKLADEQAVELAQEAAKCIRYSPGNPPTLYLAGTEAAAITLAVLSLSKRLKIAVKAIEDAPHTMGCASNAQICLTCGQNYGEHYGENCAASHDLDHWKASPVPADCDCFKSSLAAFGTPAPWQFNSDPEWLKRKANAEDDCIVSVGGLVTDLEAMAAPYPTEALEAENG